MIAPLPTVVSAVVALALSLITVEISRRLSLRRSLLDTPNERSSHLVPTPRIGGLGIWIPWVLCVAVWVRWTNDSARPLLERGTVALVAGSLIAAIVGLVDDSISRGLSPRAKYAGQLGAAAVACLLAAGFAQTSPVRAMEWALAVPALAIQVVWITAIANFTNFMDGVNGLVGGVGVVTSGVWGLLLWPQAPVAAVVMWFCALTALGFLAFNLQPGKVFMGDTGSLFLGTLWAIAALLFAKGLGPVPSSGLPPLGSRQFVGLLISLVVLAPIWVDAVTTLAIRFLMRRPLSTAHRDHLYQRMIKRGYGHARVSAAYWLYAGACAFASVLAVTRPISGLILGFLLIGGGGCAVLFAHKWGWAVHWVPTVSTRR